MPTHAQLSVPESAEVESPQGDAADASRGDGTAATCDYCGSARLEWRKCKLICENCKQINKSCADL